MQMKKYIIVALSVFVVACGNKPAEEQRENKDLLPTTIVDNPRSAVLADSVAIKDMPTMDFDDTMHDFGVMREGETVSYDFKFTNNGKTPLLVNSANGSCGCTVPEYPHEPLEPGKSAIMKVKFDATGKQGHQEKSVSISTNSNKGVHALYIKADVKPKN